MLVGQVTGLGASCCCKAFGALITHILAQEPQEPYIVSKEPSFPPKSHGFPRERAHYFSIKTKPCGHIWFLYLHIYESMYCVCMHSCIHVRICVPMYLRIYSSTCVSMHLYIYVSMYIHTYVSVYIFANWLLSSLCRLAVTWAHAPWRIGSHTRWNLANPPPPRSLRLGRVSPYVNSSSLSNGALFVQVYFIKQRWQHTIAHTVKVITFHFHSVKGRRPALSLQWRAEGPHVFHCFTQWRAAGPHFHCSEGPKARTYFTVSLSDGPQARTFTAVMGRRPALYFTVSLSDSSKLVCLFVCLTPRFDLDVCMEERTTKKIAQKLNLRSAQSKV